MNINHESPDFGRIRRLLHGEQPSPEEVELTTSEAARLSHVRKADRVELRRKMREAHPLKFSQKHRRKHR